jgi:TonB family protein
MRSQPFIINKFGLLIGVVVAMAVIASAAAAQKIAILTPEQNPQALTYSSKLADVLATKFRILDSEMSEAAFRSVLVDDPYNLSTETSKNIGSVIGCDYFVLLRAGTLRRTSFDRSEYFEAFAAVFVVSSRTGWLVFWKLQNAEANTPEKAESQLLSSTENLGQAIIAELPKISKSEANEPPAQSFEEVPASDTPAAKNFRAPIPYLRIPPEYTRLAYLYGIKATVDIQVDLDADGKILRTEIVRWAGYRLDESVETAVRKMNWRPAERNGKALPIRFLLRYNFKKIEKE